MKMLLFVAPPAPPQRTKIGRAGDPGRLRSGPTAVWRWPNPPLTPGLILQLASSPRNAPGLNSAAPAGAGLSLVKDLRGSRLHFESTHLRQHKSAAFTAGIVQILPQAIFNAGLRVAHPTRAARDVSLAMQATMALAQRRKRAKIESPAKPDHKAQIL